MEKLTTGRIAELISPDYLDPDDRRPIFEWLEVIRRKGIVYVGLDALTGTTVASAVGNAMFADLVSVAGHIYKHGIDDPAQNPEGELPKEETARPPTISLHADEFNELIGDEFVPLLNKAGGAVLMCAVPGEHPSGALRASHFSPGEMVRSPPTPRPGRTWRPASATAPRRARWPATSTP